MDPLFLSLPSWADKVGFTGEMKSDHLRSFHVLFISPWARGFAWGFVYEPAGSLN